MTHANPTFAVTDEWESGKLGASREHIRHAPAGTDAEIDEAVGLQLISIRFSKDLINNLKAIAGTRGIGYQPLIRMVLTDYVRENPRARIQQTRTPTVASSLVSRTMGGTQSRYALAAVAAMKPAAKKTVKRPVAAAAAKSKQAPTAKSPKKGASQKPKRRVQRKA